MRGYIITAIGVLGMIFSVIGGMSAMKKLEKENRQIAAKLDGIYK